MAVTRTLVRRVALVVALLVVTVATADYDDDAKNFVFSKVKLIEGGQGVVTTTFVAHTNDVFIGGTVEDSRQISWKRDVDQTKSDLRPKGVVSDGFVGQTFVAHYLAHQNALEWVFSAQPAPQSEMYLYHLAAVGEVADPIAVGIFTGPYVTMVSQDGEQFPLNALSAAFVKKEFEEPVQPVNVFLIRIDKQSGKAVWAKAFKFGWKADTKSFPVGLSITSVQDKIFLATSFIETFYYAENKTCQQSPAVTIDPVLLLIDANSGDVISTAQNFFILNEEDSHSAAAVNPTHIPDYDVYNYDGIFSEPQDQQTPNNEGPVEQQSTEQKPVEQNPVEPKPEDAKPADQQPEEQKPVGQTDEQKPEQKPDTNANDIKTDDDAKVDSKKPDETTDVKKPADVDDETKTAEDKASAKKPQPTTTNKDVVEDSSGLTKTDENKPANNKKPTAKPANDDADVTEDKPDNKATEDKADDDDKKPATNSKKPTKPVDDGDDADSKATDDDEADKKPVASNKKPTKPTNDVADSKPTNDEDEADKKPVASSKKPTKPADDDAADSKVTADEDEADKKPTKPTNDAADSKAANDEDEADKKPVASSKKPTKPADDETADSKVTDNEDEADKKPVTSNKKPTKPVDDDAADSKVTADEDEADKKPVAGNKKPTKPADDTADSKATNDEDEPDKKPVASNKKPTKPTDDDAVDNKVTDDKDEADKKPAKPVDDDKTADSKAADEPDNKAKETSQKPVADATQKRHSHRSRRSARVNRNEYIVNPDFANTIITDVAFESRVSHYSDEIINSLVVVGYQIDENYNFYNVIASIELNQDLNFLPWSVWSWQQRYFVGSQPAYPSLALFDDHAVIAGVFKDEVAFEKETMTCHKRDGRCIFVFALFSDDGNVDWHVTIEQVGQFSPSFDGVVAVSASRDYVLVSGPSTNMTRISLTKVGTKSLQMAGRWPESKNFVAMIDALEERPVLIKEIFQNAVDGSSQIATLLPTENSFAVLVGGYIRGNDLAFDFVKPRPSASQSTAFVAQIILNPAETNILLPSDDEAEQILTMSISFQIAFGMMLVAGVGVCLWRRVTRQVPLIAKGQKKSKYQRVNNLEEGDDVVYSIEDNHL